MCCGWGGEGSLVVYESGGVTGSSSHEHMLLGACGKFIMRPVGNWFFAVGSSGADLHPPQRKHFVYNGTIHSSGNGSDSVAAAR